MIAVDTSVLVAGFATWHERHEDALRVIAGETAIPVPATLETYSTLTRFPRPFRAIGADVVAFLDQFSTWLPAPGPDLHRDLLLSLVERGIEGAAVHDALIGLTTLQHGLTLLSADLRARPTYDAVGVTVRDL